MDIHAGTEIITGATVYGETAYYQDAARPVLRVALPSGITAAQIAALLAEPWELVDEGGEVCGTYNGYNTLLKHEISIVKVHPLEQAVAEAETIAETATAAVEQAQIDYDAMLLDHEYRLTILEIMGGETT